MHQSCGGGVGDSLPGTAYVSGFSQLGRSQAAERGPSFLGGADVSGASRPQNSLVVEGGGAAAPARPHWGGSAPTLPGSCIHVDCEKGPTSEGRVTEVGPEAHGCRSGLQGAMHVCVYV